MAGAAVGAAALIVLLAIPTIARQHSISKEHEKLNAQLDTNRQLQQQIGQLTEAQAKQQQLDSLRGQITGLLATDVSWSRMLQDIARTIPSDVWLTSFQGSVTQPSASTAAPATTTTVAGSSGSSPTSPTTPTPATPATPTLAGTVNFSAVGLDYPSVADWLKMIQELPSLSDLWVPSATKASIGTQEVVNFTSTATLTPKAQSDRLQSYTVGTKQ